MGMFKWLRKDFVQWDRNRRNLSSPERSTLNKSHVNRGFPGVRSSTSDETELAYNGDENSNFSNRDDRRAMLRVYFNRAVDRSNHGIRNSRFERENEEKNDRTRKYKATSGSRTAEDVANSEAYRNALQAFLDRRREPGDESEDGKSPNFSPIKNRVEYEKNGGKNASRSESESPDEDRVVPGVPHVRASEVFEVGWVAGTEDRYLELISGEWQHTRISLRRSSHPDCSDALKADLDILREVRHANTLLLMGTTRTDEHGLVAIFESVDCTLYSFIHEQGERVSVQGAARCAGQLADALRHAHARGIVHGALSSHCVHLAASGTAKLGNWELAVRDNETRPYRDWEDRLRSEIFRWQAPEIFYGDAPTKSSDVYTLTLIIWEMCTAQIPWASLNQVEVERQYIHWERGITTEAYNFPPLLNNLIEAGLRLDVTKRNLDMNRVRRFLQRVELRYENEQPLYVDRHSNNNNPGIKTLNAPVSTGNFVRDSMTLDQFSEINSKLPTSKKLFDGDHCLRSRIVRSPPTPKKINANKNELYISREKNDQDSRKKINVDLETYKNNDTFPIAVKIKNAYQRNGNEDDNVRSNAFEDTTLPKTINANEDTKIVDCETSSSNDSVSTRSPTWSDDETATDAITKLQKIKEFLATERKNFFTENNSPSKNDTSMTTDVLPNADIPQLSPRSKEIILREAKNRECEPRKPASHKISPEPKLGKSPTEYDSALIRTAIRPEIKLQRKDDSRQRIQRPDKTDSKHPNFFESTLWRREKLICLSKMCKDSAASANTTDTPPLSNSCESPASNETYIVTNKVTDENAIANESSLIGKDASALDAELTENYISQSKSLRALKEALDRATSIVRSVTPINFDASSPDVSSVVEESVFDESQTNESTFEDLNRSKLCNTDSNDEIKSIERSTMNNSDSMFVLEIPKDSEKRKSVSFDVQISDFISGSNDCPEQRFDCDDSSEAMRVSYPDQNDETDDKNESVSQLVEQSLISTATIFLSDTNPEKHCRSCRDGKLMARRRSLPAGLGQVRSFNNSSPLGRLPIRRGGVPTPTVEDLYIDDEFGDSLDVNMLLLNNECESDEDDLLPCLLETSIV